MLLQKQEQEKHQRWRQRVWPLSRVGRNARRRSCCAPGILLLLLVVASSPAITGGADAPPCTLCEFGPDQVPNSEKVVGTPGASTTTTCGMLQSSLAPLVQDGTPFCNAIRTMGTFCGCNVPPNACSLCWDGSPVTNLLLELPDYQARDLVPLSPIDTALTCESLESYLNTLGESDAQCLSIQQDAGERCGCPPLLVEEPPSNANNNTATPQNATVTNATVPPAVEEQNTDSNEQTETQEPRQSCTPCRNREDSIMFPDLPLPAGDLPLESCADLGFFASLLGEDDVECDVVRAVGFYCGCPRPPDACTLCPNGESVPNPSRTLTWISRNMQYVPEGFEEAGNSVTCGIMEGLVASNSAELLGTTEDLLCLAAQLKSSICGCSPDWRQILLTWAYRLSGMLSLLGSTSIIVDICRKRRTKQFTTYHQLMIGVSFFDCMSSLAYIMVGVMAPADDGFYLSRGNDATCTVQGVMIQIGQTSVFYNMCLSLYFLLVISYNWKEHQFKKIGRWVHAAVLLLGVSMGFGAIPYIGPQFGVCGILQTPAAANNFLVTIFHAVPVGVALVILTGATIAICVKVHQQQVKAKKWMLQQNLNLTRKVVWQSFWYVMAFYATIPFLIVFSYYSLLPTKDYFSIFVVAASLRPIQGFLNALVYFQRSQGKAIFNVVCACFVKRESVTQGRSQAGKNSKNGKGKGASERADVGKQTINSTLSLAEQEFVRPAERGQEDLTEGQQNGTTRTCKSTQTDCHTDRRTAPGENWVDNVGADVEVPIKVRVRTEVTFSAVHEHWRLNESSESIDNESEAVAELGQDGYCSPPRRRLVRLSSWRSSLARKRPASPPNVVEGSQDSAVDKVIATEETPSGAQEPDSFPSRE